MKAWFILILGMGLAAGTWSQETLALRVHKSVTDPEGTGIDRTFTFYTDGQGRVIRIHEVNKGSFEGDPDLESDTVLSWNGLRVTWSQLGEDTGFEAGLEFDSGGLRFRLESPSSPGATPVRTAAVHYVSGTSNSWEDGRFRYSWSRLQGFQSDAIDSRARPNNEVEYKTAGSRVSAWTPNGFEETRLLLNQTPKALLGTYYRQYETKEEWYPMGELQVTGLGLWNPDPTVRLVHVFLLEQCGISPEATAFVFEQKFLR